MRLKIFGSIIRVLKKKDMSQQGLRGLYMPKEKLILVDSELLDDDFMQCLVHELVHSVIYRTGIDQAQISAGVEEIICENIATAIIENFTLKAKK